MRAPRPSVLLVVLLGLLVVGLPAAPQATLALFSDSALLRTGRLSAGSAFPPPKPISISCRVNRGNLLVIGVRLTEEQAESDYKYELRLVKVDVSPESQRFEDTDMNFDEDDERATSDEIPASVLGGSAATRAGSYQARVTIRDARTGRESLARVIRFEVTGSGSVFSCGTEVT